MRNSLRAGRDVVIDAKNLSKAERAEWISMAKQAAAVSPSMIICARHPTEAEVWNSVRCCLQHGCRLANSCAGHGIA